MYHPVQLELCLRSCLVKWLNSPHFDSPGFLHISPKCTAAASDIQKARAFIRYELQHFWPGIPEVLFGLDFIVVIHRVLSSIMARKTLVKNASIEGYDQKTPSRHKTPDK